MLQKYVIMLLSKIFLLGHRPERSAAFSRDTCSPPQHWSCSNSWRHLPPSLKLLNAHSEVGLLIQHHTLLAEVPIDLLPYSLSHTIPARSKIFSTSCCPLPSSNRPRHYWVPYHTRLLNPLFHLKFPFLFYLFYADTVYTVVHPLLYLYSTCDKLLLLY